MKGLANVAARRPFAVIKGAQVTPWMGQPLHVIRSKGVGEEMGTYALT